MADRPVPHPRPRLFVAPVSIFAFVALGILGSAFVMLQSMAHDGRADLHGVAAVHTMRLALAMRANRGYWADTAISPCFSTSGAHVPGCGYLTVPSQMAECGACTARARAISDLGAWRDRLEAALPQPSLDVACLGGQAGTRAGSGRSCSIRVAWVPPAGGQRQRAPGRHSYVVRVMP